MPLFILGKPDTCPHISHVPTGKELEGTAVLVDEDGFNFLFGIAVGK